MPSTPPVAVSFSHGVASIELARPRSGNRIDAPMAAAIRSAAAQVSQDDRVRAVIISGHGSRFCAGGQPLAPGVLKDLQAASAIAAIAQPVVIALQGDTFDQGLEVALAADIRVASSDARFAMRHLADGGMPFDGGTQRLPRIVGRGLALDMLLTGRVLDAGEALARGLVTEVVDGDELQRRAHELASRIAKRGSTASRYAKEAMARGVEMPLDEGLRLEADLSLLLFEDPERAEGLRAFRDRRAPRFA